MKHSDTKQVKRLWAVSLLVLITLPQLALAQQPDQKAADIRELRLREPIERQFSGGDVHSYRIALNAGQYLSVLVEEKGIDLVVRMMASDGKKLAEGDNDPMMNSESVFAIADGSPGLPLYLRHRLRISTLLRV